MRARARFAPVRCLCNATRVTDLINRIPEFTTADNIFDTVFGNFMIHLPNANSNQARRIAVNFHFNVLGLPVINGTVARKY